MTPDYSEAIADARTAILNLAEQHMGEPIMTELLTLSTTVGNLTPRGE